MSLDAMSPTYVGSPDYFTYPVSIGLGEPADLPPQLSAQPARLMLLPGVDEYDIVHVEGELVRVPRLVVVQRPVLKVAWKRGKLYITVPVYGEVYLIQTPSPLPRWEGGWGFDKKCKI